MTKEMKNQILTIVGEAIGESSLCLWKSQLLDRVAIFQTSQASEIETRATNAICKLVDEEIARIKDVAVIAPQHPDIKGCHCRLCNPDLVGQAMFLCPTCGNKRCPSSTDHRLSCNHSNAPGQEGSVY